MIVHFTNTHNHLTDSARALWRRDVSAPTRQRLLDLFGSGHGAAESLAILRFELLENANADDISHIMADRSLLPGLSYVDT